MSGKQPFNIHTILERLGGETIVSGEGSFPHSSANSPIPERQDIQDIIEPERPENFIKADDEKESCLQELYSNLSDEVVSQQIEKFSTYARYFKGFVGNNIDEINSLSVRSFLNIRTQLGLWYIVMGDLAEPVLRTANNNIRLFDEEYLMAKKTRLENELCQLPKTVASKEKLEAYIKDLQIQKYNILALDNRLDYLFELCQEFIKMEKEKFYKEQQQQKEEPVNFLKDITIKALKKYREYDEGVLMRLASCWFGYSAERFEITSLNKFEKFIKYSENDDEVIFVLGNYYHEHLNADSIQGNEKSLVTNYSFISFFLEELSVKSKAASITSLEHKIREQSREYNDGIFVGFKLNFSSNYHEKLGEGERINMLVALTLFNDLSIVNKIEQRIKDEEEKFVMVVYGKNG